MEIKGTGAPLFQQPQPTEIVQRTASVSGSQSVDRVVAQENVAARTAAASLPPPPAPEVVLDQKALRGAESFATQLGEIGGPAASGPDLMAAFLKLQVLQGDVDRHWTKLLSDIKTKMAHLTIANAKQIEAVIGSVAAVAAVMRAICQQVNADVTRAGEELKELLEETLMAELEGKKEDDDEKAVGEEELERKYGKSSMADTDALAAAQLTAAVTAEAGGVSGGDVTILSIDNMRPHVAGAVLALVGNSSSAAGLRLGEV
jgi:hypothetical protein